METKAKGGKKTRKYGRNKRKAMAKNTPFSLYVQGKITFDQYQKRTQ